ncbi:MAG: Asp-tRNA(Asn)/Glu-tRNA(Gln) amidotransferase subunit GatA [Ornithinimicrobium sp.]
MLSAAEMANALLAGDFTSEELTQAHLRRIAAIDPIIHAYLYVDEQGALATAREVDADRALGKALHPMAGVPVAIKDIASTMGMPTTAGSRMLADWVPPYDATIVAKLREARMPILGKTNMDEFAMGSSTEHSAFGVTRNPWDTGRIPGGSGGGSAAAVAAYLAPWAIGSDTGGSIRQPASVTGTVGAKPTYGAVSRYGIIALASSLDQIGPCTRTVADAALLQAVIGGHDEMDSTSLPGPAAPVAQAAETRDLSGMRVGVVEEISGEGFQPGVQERFDDAVAQLTSLGAEVVRVSCPHFVYAMAAYYLILPSEASSNLARYDAMRYGLRVGPDDVAAPSAEQVMASSRDAGFGDEVKRRIILGTYALSSGYYDAYYAQAQKVRTLIARDFAAAFEQVDVLVSPTTPTTAFEFGQNDDNPLSMYLNDIATIPANLAGVPGLSLPCGLAAEDGLPVGLQILAPATQDDRMYAVGAALEAALEAAWGGPLLAKAPAVVPANAREEARA